MDRLRRVLAWWAGVPTWGRVGLAGGGLAGVVFAGGFYLAVDILPLQQLAAPVREERAAPQPRPETEAPSGGLGRYGIGAGEEPPAAKPKAAMERAAREAAPAPRPVPAPVPRAAPAPVPRAPAAANGGERRPAAAAPAPAPAAPRSTIRVSAHDFLLRGALASEGYGLYSYLLFPSNDAASRPRSTAALKALIEQVDPRAAVEAAGFEPREINITYVPMSEAVPERPALDWLVDRYDYARAKRILGFVVAEPSPGPYLVSFLRPLDRAPGADEEALVQDLSWVPPDLVTLWVAAFTRDVRQPRFWDKEHLSSFALRMRTLVAVAAEPFGIGAKAAERYVDLKKAIGGN